MLSSGSNGWVVGCVMLLRVGRGRETLDEAGALVEAHAEQVTKNTTHAITIKGAVDEPRRRRPRPPSGRAPI